TKPASTLATHAAMPTGTTRTEKDGGGHPRNSPTCQTTTPSTRSWPWRMGTPGLAGADSLEEDTPAEVLDAEGIPAEDKEVVVEDDAAEEDEGSPTGVVED